MEITIRIAEPTYDLYDHQKEALSALNLVFKQNKNFKGIVCIPTGGGKTHTAVVWAYQKFLSKQLPVIWIAHRQELIRQAAESFVKNAYSCYCNDRNTINVRMVSAEHEDFSDITGAEDVLIISNFTFANRADEICAKFKNKGAKEVLLVIDEAHHAVARTYRTTIDAVFTKFNATLIGLTATPYRTLEEERGAMHTVFPNGIIYKVGLNMLIGRGILSEPLVTEVETNIDFREEAKAFTQNGNLSSEIKIPDTISENLRSLLDERNKYIVKVYIDNRDKYGQTIVFTINRTNAFALAELFNKEGIKAGYIVSGDTDTEKRTEVIDSFRDKQIQVLVNVNILTEGTDVPNIQTVFLARPTMSDILLMQMMGRGLRGPIAGGTEKCNVISFIDNWVDRITWASPSELLNDNYTPTDLVASNAQQIKELIDKEAIRGIIAEEKFKDQLDGLAFVDRVPVGFYLVNYTFSNEQETNYTKKENVMVFCFNIGGYQNFIKALPEIVTKFSDKNSDKIYDILPQTDEVSRLVETVLNDYFESDLCVNRDWIVDILNFYLQKNESPKFIAFANREKYDLKDIAETIRAEDMRVSEKTKYCIEKYKLSPEEWEGFLGIGSQDKFIEAVSREVNLLYKAAQEVPEKDIYAESYDLNIQASILLAPTGNAMPVPALARTNFVELYSNLDDGVKAQLNDLWLSDYSTLRLEVLKKCIIKETETQVNREPTVESFITHVFDKEIDRSRHQGFGDAAHSALNELIEKFKSAILSYKNQGEISKEEPLLALENILNNTFKRGEIERDIINGLFNVYKNQEILSQDDLARKHNLTRERIRQLAEDAAQRITGIVQSFKNYEIEKIPKDSEVFTGNFLHFCDAEICNNRKLVGDYNAILFGTRRQIHYCSNLYSLEPKFADKVIAVLTAISKKLQTEYGEYNLEMDEITSSLKNLSSAEAESLIAIVNKEGEGLAVKKIFRGRQQPTYTNMQFKILENRTGIDIIHEGINQQEALRRIFYELTPDTALRRQDLLRYFIENNQYGFASTNVINMNYSAILNLKLVGERWFTKDYLSTFVDWNGINTYEGRRRPTLADLMVEMIKKNEALNGLTKNEWRDRLNEIFKVGAITSNNLAFVAQDNRFIINSRKVFLA